MYPEGGASLLLEFAMRTASIEGFIVQKRNQAAANAEPDSFFILFFCLFGSHLDLLKDTITCICVHITGSLLQKLNDSLIGNSRNLRVI